MEPSHRFQDSLVPEGDLTSTLQRSSGWGPREVDDVGLSCSFENVDTLVSTFAAPRDLLSSVALSAESSDNSTFANDAQQLTPDIRPTRSRSYSEAMWTVQKPRIRELYLQQRKTLKEVMTEMEQRYGFKATENMYKKKFTSWGFDKKHKLHEAQAIIRKRAQRSAAGKRTTFYLRGRLVDLDDVERFLRRKRRSIEADRLGSAPTPPDLVCLSVPASPQSPEKFRPLEVIFTHYKNYVNSALDSRLWINESDDQGLFSAKESHGSTGDLFNFCASSFDLLNRGLFAEAGKLLRHTAICLEEAVVSEDPYLLTNLVSALENFQTNYKGVSDILCKHGANLAAKFLAESHPLRYICAALRSDPVLGTEDSIADLLEGMCITLRDHLGVQNINTIDLEFRVIRRRGQRQNVDNAKWQLQQIKCRIEQNCGSGNIRYLRALFHIATIFSLYAEYSEAEMTAYEMLKILEDESTFSAHGKLFYRCKALQILSYCLYDRSDLILAEETLREGIKIALSVQGLEGEALFLHEILETWLREWGRLQEADEVRALHSKLVDDLYPEDDILIT